MLNFFNLVGCATYKEKKSFQNVLRDKENHFHNLIQIMNFKCQKLPKS